MKKCFNCKKDLPLDAFKIDRRKYQLKNSKGRCVVCHNCNLEKSLETLSCLRYDYEQCKYVSIYFKNEKQVREFYKQELKD